MPKNSLGRLGVFALSAALTVPVAALPASAAESDTPSVFSQSARSASQAGNGATRVVTDDPQADAMAPTRVVVMLKEQPQAPSLSTENTNLAAQNELIAAWSKEYGLVLDRQFGYLLNGFSATIPAEKITELEALPQVASVKKERVYYPTEHTGRELQGVSQAFKDYGVDGTGMVVSIIDSGIDPTHQDMRLDNCDGAKITTVNSTPGAGFTCKVPNGYNYADEDYVIKDTTSSQHGMHVAGIVAANGSEGANTDAFAQGRIDGVAPNAQLLAMKVFSNKGGGASDSDIVAAIEDSVKMGADVINMSLGSPNGSNNASDGMARAIAQARANGVLTLVAAGNEGLNFSPSGTTDDLFGLWDDGTLGAPSSQEGAFTVGSIENTIITQPIAHMGGALDKDVAYSLQTGSADNKEYELVYVGRSDAKDYTDQTDLSGKFALIERGDISFAKKYENAVAHNAAGIVVFDNPGNELLSMGGIDTYTLPSVSIYRSDALEAIEKMKNGEKVTITLTERTLTEKNPAGLTPSSFTSWGGTPSLDFEPEISGIGGNVYSTLNGNKYGTKSGTSMATPNVAGLSALLLQNYATRFNQMSALERLQLVEIALMNTAQIPEHNSIPYAPRQIGAGLARIDKALTTNVFATVDGDASVALREVTGTRTFTVTLTNKSDKPVSYSVPAQVVVNETNNAEEEARTFLSKETLTADSSKVTVGPLGTATVTFTLTPDTSTKHFIEGWARFTSQTDGAPDLSVPYMGFVGDWDEEPIFVQPGKSWGDGVHDSVTQMLTSWSGMTIPLNSSIGTFWVSPNSDGDIDVAVPDLMYMRNASDVVYEILDSSGNLVKTLGSEQDVARDRAIEILATDDSKARTAKGMKFDGTTYDPQKGDFVALPDGMYTYRVRARVWEQGQWQQIEFPVGVDATDPVLKFGEIKGNELELTVVEETSGVLADPTVVDQNGDELPVKKVADNRYVVTIADPSAVAYVTGSVVDAGFNLGTATKVFTSNSVIVPDADSINDPDTVLGPNSQIVGDGKLRVEGFASADVASLTINGESLEIEDGRFVGFVPLSEGPNTVTVLGFDASGAQIAEVILSPVYDSTAPVVQINDLDAEGKLVLGADGTVTVSGTITDTRAGAKLSVTVGGEKVTVEANGSFTVKVTPEADQASVVVKGSDGVNTVTETLLIAGRTVEVPAEWNAPEFTNVDCSNGVTACFVDPGTKDLKGDTFTLKGKVNSPVTSITLTPSLRANEDGTMPTPQPITVEVKADGTFEVPIKLTTGINDFLYEVVDADGATRISQSAHFYMDVVLPSIAFTEPMLTGGTLFANTDEVAFAGTASDDGWGYELTVNDDSFLELFNGSGFGPESNERTFSKNVRVADGDTILVLLNDAMGNTLVGAIPVIVDKVLPEVTIENLAEGERVSVAREVNVKATDEHLASARVLLNGEVVAEESTKLASKTAPLEQSLIDSRLVDTVGTDVNGTVTDTLEKELNLAVSTADLKPGSYTLTVEATDLAGNTTATSVSFEVVEKTLEKFPNSFIYDFDGDGTWDFSNAYGRVTDEPLIGDWNGDGIATPAVRRGNSFMLVNTLDGSQATTTFAYGRADDQVVVGDWDGDGKDTIAVIRGNMIHVSNGTAGGEADYSYAYGRIGDRYLAGDWNGDRKDTLAIVRGNMFFVTNKVKEGGASDYTYAFGKVTDRAVVGDWDGDNKDTVSLVRSTLFFVNNTEQATASQTVALSSTADGKALLAGDLNGDGKDSLVIR